MSNLDSEHPTVRFTSENEEIEPESSLEQAQSLADDNGREDLSPEAKQELRSLAVTMQASLLLAQTHTLLPLTSVL
jgi:hypothetical protein